MATTNGSFGQQDQYKPTPEHYPTGSVTETTASNSGNGDLSKDEIGWYFVEQYYTTLSRSPEKLHLFYNKRSQFVSGVEAEVTPVSVGRPAIQDRIKELDFQESKVRLSNVDSQASDDHIIIQVIGEISNKSADLQKFVQTFVLAQQPTGYFVLNDIFRYIKDDVEEEGVTTEEAPVPIIEASNEAVAAPVDVEAKSTGLDATVVDKKLEETLEAEPEADKVVAPTNGDIAVKAPEEEAPVPQVEEPAQDPEAVEKAIEEEDVKEGDKPKEPLPTPAISRIPSSTNPPAAQPASPAKPLSWASRAAAANASNPPRPVVPAAKPATTAAAPAQPKAAPAPQAAQAASTPAAQPTAALSSANKENESPQQSGWQTAGSEHSKRQNRPQSISAPAQKEGTMGYVRNVTEAVKTEELRAELASFGELSYFDINRQKNCAFVEYATEAGYHAAVAANPHVLSGENVMVEPRRPKANAYGGNNYAGGRGAINNNNNNRGRGGFEAGRQGSQRGRGDFNNRTPRGGASGAGPRGGRGATQAANA